MNGRPLPDLWTVRTSSGGRVSRREGDRFIPTSTPWVRERASLLRLFAGNDFRARYRGQALGVLWSLLQPLVMMTILSVVFTRAFRSTEPNFPVFVLIGLLVWQWVSSALTAATVSFINNADMVKRTVFPRVLLPISSVVSFGMNALIESIALIAIIPFFKGSFVPSVSLLCLPLVVLSLVVLLSGASLAFAALNVIYRDVAYLVTTGLAIFYWLTPVIYPPTMLPERFRVVLAWNPLGAVITAMRGIIMHGVAPSLADWLHISVGSIVVALIGLLLFRRHERDMLDHV